MARHDRPDVQLAELDDRAADRPFELDRVPVQAPVKAEAGLRRPEAPQQAGAELAARIVLIRRAIGGLDLEVPSEREAIRRGGISLCPRRSDGHQQ